MNDPVSSNEVTRLGQATRFAIACVVMGVSYLAISSCLSIPRFSRLFSDMLGVNAQLPAITLFVLRTHIALLVLSCCIPVAAIALLFTRNIVRSLHCMGVLALISILDYAALWHAKASPLMKIIEQMAGDLSGGGGL